MLDPLGRLQVKQQVVPLNTGRDIDIFGGAPVRGAKRFAVKAALNGESYAGERCAISLRRRSTLRLSDDDKLAGPSFEEMEAGLVFGSEALSFAATELIAAPMAYESIVIDALAAPPAAAGPRYQLTCGAIAVACGKRGGGAGADTQRGAGALPQCEQAGAAASLQSPKWRIMPLGDGAATAVAANVEDLQRISSATGDAEPRRRSSGRSSPCTSSPPENGQTTMPTTDPNANLTFLPWVRQGAAASITTVDTLGDGSAASPTSLLRSRSTTVRRRSRFPCAFAGRPTSSASTRIRSCARTRGRAASTSSPTIFPASSSTGPISRGCSRRRGRTRTRDCGRGCAWSWCASRMA